jgi:hypothetical protein
MLRIRVYPDVRLGRLQRCPTISEVTCGRWRHDSELNKLAILCVQRAITRVYELFRDLRIGFWRMITSSGSTGILAVSVTFGFDDI